MTAFAWILLLRLVAAPEAAAAPEALDSPGIHAPGDAEKKPAEGEKKPEKKPVPPKAPAEKPEKKPAPGKGGPSCSLPSEEGPRGGRLVIEGEGFGRTPVVRIGDRVTRILLREKTTLSVQIPRDSDGGPVTVEADGIRSACGWLTIVGKDR